MGIPTDVDGLHPLAATSGWSLRAWEQAWEHVRQNWPADLHDAVWGAVVALATFTSPYAMARAVHSARALTTTTSKD